MKVVTPALCIINVGLQHSNRYKAMARKRRYEILVRRGEGGDRVVRCAEIIDGCSTVRYRVRICMNADVFIDTNVLLYSIDVDPASTAKRQRAEQLLLSERWGWSVQVAAEFFVNATSTKRPSVN